jgi:hypothetical protein
MGSSLPKKKKKKIKEEEVLLPALWASEVYEEWATLYYSQIGQSTIY